MATPTSSLVNVSQTAENFWRCVELLLDEVPAKLRDYFVQQWNQKYANNVWDHTQTSGQFFWQGKGEAGATPGTFLLALATEDFFLMLQRL